MQDLFEKITHREDKMHMHAVRPATSDPRPLHAIFSKSGRCFLALLILLLLGGCASRGPQNFQTPVGNLFQQDGYEKMLKRQMASIPPEPEAVRRLPEMNADDYERLGDNYFRQGRLELAFLQYGKVIQQNPNNVNAICKRGFIYLKRGMNDFAMADFTNVLAKNRNHALAHQGMGMIHLRMKNYKAAQESLRSSVRSNPELWMAHNFLGIVHDHLGEHAEAVASYQTAIRIKPDQSALYNNLGVSLAFMGRDEEAAEAFRRGLNFHPVDPRIGNNLGMVLCKLGRYHEALEAFRTSGDEAHAYNNVGAFLLEEGEYTKAVLAFQRAIELRGTHYAKARDNLRRAEVEMRGGGMVSRPVAQRGPAAPPRAPVAEARPVPDEAKESAQSF